MKTSILKTNVVTRDRVIDHSSGEVLSETVNRTTYLANTKEEFFLMYSSMVLILKGSSDVRMKLFAALLERYAHGQEFSISKSFKTILSGELNCSPRSFDTAVSSLVKDNIVIRIGSGLYKINPRHVFQGSSSNRNEALKAIIELGCRDC